VPGGAASDTRPGLDPAHARAGLAPVLGLLAVQYLVVGLLDVAMVALAIGVLGLGASGAGTSMPPSGPVARSAPCSRSR
jgi:hypothetical protein